MVRPGSVNNIEAAKAGERPPAEKQTQEKNPDALLPEHLWCKIYKTAVDEDVAAEVGQLNRSRWGKGKAVFLRSN